MSLASFYYNITCQYKKQQDLSNALSKELYLEPKVWKATYDQQQMIFLKSWQLCFWATTLSIVVDSLLSNKICRSLTTNSLVFDIKQHTSNIEDDTKKI